MFRGICREARDFFVVPVDDCTADTLLAVIRDYIEEGTTIISDSWKVYNCLDKEGYHHI